MYNPKQISEPSPPLTLAAKRWLCIGLGVLAASVSSTPAYAVGTRHWVLERGEDFKGGDLRGVAVDSSGKVRAGFDLGRQPIEGDAVIWSALGRKDGSILLGTGNEGRLLELRDGRVNKLAESGALVITSLVEGWDSAVFAASIPQGKVFKWEHNKLSLFASLPGVEHVWQLAYDARRATLYAATGPQGKLFRIGKDGHADVEFDAPEDHLMSLAIMPDGTLVAGSSEKAKLYHVTGPGRSTVMYDFARTEVRAIAVSSRGDVYAIANARCIHWIRRERSPPPTRRGRCGAASCRWRRCSVSGRRARPSPRIFAAPSPPSCWRTGRLSTSGAGDRGISRRQDGRSGGAVHPAAGLAALARHYRMISGVDAA